MKRRTIVPNASDFVCKWTAEKFGINSFPAGCYGMAIMWDNQMIAGVVYHDLSDHNCALSLYSTTPLWAGRDTLRAIFSYPFNQLGLARVTAIVKPGNQKWRKILTDKIGFVHEAKLWDWFGEGKGAHLYRMTRAECRWIDEQGQQQQRAAV